MSKASRQRRKEKRDKAKHARKLANYLRCGPKAGGGKNKKKARTVAGNVEPEPMAPQKTSLKARRRRRRNGLQWCRKTR